MSSTNRGTRGGNGHDQFPTPAWCVHRLLEAIELPGSNWLEPCAGAGAIIKAVNEKRNGVHWYAWDIDGKYRDSLVWSIGTDRVQIGDALKLSIPPSTHTILTNPPFFISHLLAEHFLASSKALVVFLQRLNWCAGPRAAMFRGQRPSVYVLPDRPSFTPDGKTDSIEFAWFVFDGAGDFQVLESTPLEIRSAAKRELKESHLMAGLQ